MLSISSIVISENTPPTIPQNQQQIVKNDTVKLTWDPSYDDHGIKTYVLRYSAKADMSSATEIALKDCSCLLNELGNGRWYWQVKAVDEEDQSSGWSEVSSFIISYSEDLPDAPQGNFIKTSKKDSVLSWAGISQAQAQTIFYKTLVNE